MGSPFECTRVVTVWECFQKNHLSSQSRSLEIGALTLTAVEITRAITMASNVNRILMRAGVDKPSGAKNTGETDSEFSLNISSCIGNRQDVVRISRTSCVHRNDRAEISMFSAWCHVKHTLNTAQ